MRMRIYVQNEDLDAKEPFPNGFPFTGGHFVGGKKCNIPTSTDSRILL